jgi:Ca2+-binding EF-hand superfamily protein
MKTLLFSALAIWGLALPALAQDTRPEPPAILFPLIQPGGTLDLTIVSARQLFRELDANSDGALNGADIAFEKAIAAAGFRASALMRIMTADLDGDGAVTEQELLSKQRYDQRRNDPASGAAAKARAERDAAQIREAMAIDTDKDGRITSEEAVGLGMAWMARNDSSPQSSGGRLRELLEQTGTDTVSTEQFMDIATDLFKATDADGNGTISQGEFPALRKRMEERQRHAAMAEQQRKAEAARKACALPKPSSAAKVLLLSAYEGDALSTATIETQDVEVRTASITVEPGDEPLYVVALSHRAMIWRLSGAAERVERVVLASQSIVEAGVSRSDVRPLAGITGIPADKVTFLPKPLCLSYFSETPSIEAARTIGIVKGETGRAPIVATRYSVSDVAIPSATLQPSRDRSAARTAIRTRGDGTSYSIDPNGIPRPEAARNNELESEALRFYPGGVVEIDAGAVVASGEAARYEVLPSQAGLLQLVRSGALSRNRKGDFLIKQKIRFPAGLYGAHSVRFLLLSGVPVPDGDPGHSCAVSEETGQPLAGVRTSC